MVLLVMGPHAQDFNGSALWKHLIYQPVLDVNPARESSAQITLEFFKRRLLLKRIDPKNRKERLGFFSQARAREFLRILFSLPSKVKGPIHWGKGVEGCETLPPQDFLAFGEGCFHPFLNGFSHSRDGKQIQSFLNGSPIITRYKDGVRSLTGDLNRFVGFGSVIHQSIQLGAGIGRGKSLHACSL